MTINSKNLFPNNEPPNLPGLGGGGGGTNAITGKAKSKTLSAYMSDAFKISTIPVRFLLGIKSPVDENEKFADSYKTPEDEVSSAISSFNQNELPAHLPGLGGGGGGTNAITDKAKNKTFVTYMEDAFKIATFPFSRRNVKADPTEKFASEYVEADSSNNQMIRPNTTEQDDVKTIAASINQSVGRSGGVTTVIQPVINNVQVPVSVPQPTPFPVKGKTNTVIIDASKMNNILAKSIR